MCNDDVRSDAVKLLFKIIIFNIIIPMVLVTGALTYWQSKSAKSVEVQVKAQVEDQMDYVAERINSQLIEKQQYLEDKARMFSTIELYYSAINSNNREDWEAIPAYQQWTKDFAIGSVEESDIIDTYVGYKGIDRALDDKWVNLPPGYNSNTRDWFTETVAVNGFHITSPYISANVDNSTMSVTMGYPIYKRGITEGGASDIIGVAALNLDINEIGAIVSELEQRFQSMINLYDINGAVLFDETYESMVAAGTIQPEPGQIMKYSDYIMQMSSGLTREAAEASFNRMASEKGSYIQEYNGRKLIVGHMTMGGGSWILNMTQPFEVNGGALLQAEEMSNITTGATLLVVLIISTILINFLIVKNIIRSSAALERISEGDADLTASIEVSTRDEIGRLGISFNSFVGKLKGWIVQIKDVISETDSVSMQVASSTEETTAAVEEASAILQSISSEVDNLDNSIAQTVSAIEQINSNVTSMDSQITDQASMVEESTAAITEMIASLANVGAITKNKQKATEELSRVAMEGKQQIENTLDIFKQVVVNISSIQEMADSINAISSQTNLLSMNAAIEAAHAGDAGKGFAVVAEEIRKLAETAAQSSANITSMISSVTESVNLTDESVKKTSNMFDEINREVIDTVNAFTEIEHSITELNIGSQQVLQSSEEISTVTNNIQSGSNEIKNGAESILNSSGVVRDVSQKVNSGMKEVTTGNNEILNAMQIMVDHSKKLDSIVNQLKEQFGGFKTE